MSDALAQALARIAELEREREADRAALRKHRTWACCECRTDGHALDEQAFCAECVRRLAGEAVTTTQAKLDTKHHDLSQIASSLAEFDRVEAIGMQSATMPEKIDALLRDLARLRRKDRERPAALAEVERAKSAEREVEVVRVACAQQSTRLDTLESERAAALARVAEVEREKDELRAGIHAACGHRHGDGEACVLGAVTLLRERTEERDEHAAKRSEFASEARSLRVQLEETRAALRLREEQWLAMHDALRRIVWEGLTTDGRLCPSGQLTVRLREGRELLRPIPDGAPAPREG